MQNLYDDFLCVLSKSFTLRSTSHFSVMGHIFQTCFQTNDGFFNGQVPVKKGFFIGILVLSYLLPSFLVWQPLYYIF